jgi:hypothetical protein
MYFMNRSLAFWNPRPYPAERDKSADVPTSLNPQACSARETWPRHWNNFQFRHFDDAMRPAIRIHGKPFGQSRATFRYILEALEDGYVETNMIIPQQAVPALSEHWLVIWHATKKVRRFEIGAWHSKERRQGECSSAGAPYNPVTAPGEVTPAGRQQEK